MRKFKNVYVEITKACNLKCTFCPSKNNISKEYLSFDNFKHVINQIKDYTEGIYLHILGEPLLHKGLEDILNILEKYNLKANITTNGTLIKDNFEIVKKSKAVRQINFSLHSSTQNKEFSNEYLLNIFESADELKDIIISFIL